MKFSGGAFGVGLFDETDAAPSAAVVPMVSSSAA
jgi:hypothetical protein